MSKYITHALAGLLLLSCSPDKPAPPFALGVSTLPGIAGQYQYKIKPGVADQKHPMFQQKVKFSGIIAGKAWTDGHIVVKLCDLQSDSICAHWTKKTPDNGAYAWAKRGSIAMAKARVSSVVWKEGIPILFLDGDTLVEQPEKNINPARP